MAGQLRSMLFQRAQAGDVAILIFLAKVLLGMKEPKAYDSEVNVNVAAVAGAESQHVFVFNDTVKQKLTDLIQGRRLKDISDLPLDLAI